MSGGDPTWTVKQSDYKGINVVLESPDKQKFELQFHTPESFKLKDGELHELYEKWRVIEDKSSGEAIRLSKMMKELSGSLKIPKNIDKIR